MYLFFSRKAKATKESMYGENKLGKGDAGLSKTYEKIFLTSMVNCPDAVTAPPVDL